MQLKRVSPLRTGGFSMIEVLITIVVLSIGFLGLAKMQASAVSNTQTARTRSLVALQAGSLVSAMHANSAFWAENPVSNPAPSFTSVGTTITTSATSLTSPPASMCLTATCTKEQLAAADVKTWVAGLNSRFPSYTAAVTCAVRTATAPAACRITVTWLENIVAMNSTTAATGAASSARPSFTLFVEP